MHRFPHRVLCGYITADYMLFYYVFRFFGVHFYIRNFFFARLKNFYYRLIFAQSYTADLLRRDFIEFFRRDFFFQGVHDRRCSRRYAASGHSHDDFYFSGLFRFYFKLCFCFFSDRV
jgi:hypothetical protein